MVECHVKGTFYHFFMVFQGPIFRRNDLSVSGFTTVAKALVNHSNQQELLGNDPLECADVDQWLYYSQSYVCSADNTQMKVACKVS